MLTGPALWLLLVGIGGAFLLWIIRMARQSAMSRGQFLMDAGAMISLGVTALMAFNMVRPSPQVDGLVRENAVSVALALLYAAFIMTMNLIDSTKPNGRLKPPGSPSFEP